MALSQIVKEIKDGAGASFNMVFGRKADGTSHLPAHALLDTSEAMVDPATSGNQSTLNTRAGDLTETAPGTDTASSGINGRLQRLAQRLTSLIALHPASLGQKAKAASLAVTLASDEDLLGRIGEVQASPTANTLLDRLKALLTGIVLAAGSNLIGKVNLAPTSAANGSTGSRVVSAAMTNATSLKGSAGQVYDITVYNFSAATKYFKLFNLAAAPTVGTDVPIWTIPIPAGGGFSKQFVHGLSFSTGIAFAITGGLPDSDTTAIGAGDVHGLIQWV